MGLLDFSRMQLPLSRIVLVSVLIVLLACVSVGGYLLYQQADAILTEQIYEHLNTATASRAEHIKTYLEDIRVEANTMSKGIAFQNLLSTENNSSAYAGYFQSSEARLDQIKKDEEKYDEDFIIGLDGKVIASSNRNHIGLNRSSDPLFTDGKNGLYFKDAYISDVTGRPQLAISAPIENPNGTVLGVYAVRINMDDLDEITSEKTGLGGSGEFVLLNKDSVTITPLRYRPNSALTYRVDTDLSRKCIEDIEEYESAAGEIEEHEEEVMVYKDYRNVTVIGTHNYALPQAPWCVIAKVDEAEALGKPRNELLGTFLIFGGAVTAILAILSYVMSKAVTRAINNLSSDVEQITKGNLGIRLRYSNISEVQSLTNSLNRVLASLKLAVLRTGLSQEDIGLGAALAAKKEAENRYLALFNSINEIVMVNKVSPDGPGKFIEVNDYACKTFGFSKDEMLGMAPSDLDASLKDKANTANVVGRLLKGEDVIYNQVNKTKDGRKITVALTLRLIDINGEKCILSTGQDITEKQELEEKFRTLYMNSGDAIMTLEPPSWRFTAGNPAAFRLYGVKDEKEFVSLGPGDLSPKYQPDGKLSATKAKEMIEKAMKEGSAYFEWTHKKHKGGDFPSTVLLSKVKLGDHDALQATVRDLSAEKQMAHALSETKMLEKLALDAVPDSFFVCDVGGRFLSWNKEFRESTGYSDDEIGKMKAIDFFSKEDAAKASVAIAKGIRSGKATLVADVIAKDGSRLPTEFVGSVLKDQKGKVIGFAGVGRRLEMEGRKK